MSNNAESICRKLAGNLRRRALHAFIVHCWTKTVRIAPRTSYYIDGSIHSDFVENPTLSQLWLGRPNSNHLLLHYEIYRFNTLGVVYAILLLCWSTPCLITLLRYTLSYYMAKKFPISIHCCAIPNPNTILRYTLSYYMAKQFPVSIHCWAIPNPNTMFRFTQL